jgi:dihydroxyacid dehydratase/phosphogluconate dehydratase
MRRPATSSRIRSPVRTFGTIVLHVTPESAVGGPLALVRTGDRIRLDVAGPSRRMKSKSQPSSAWVTVSWNRRA